MWLMPPPPTVLPNHQNSCQATRIYENAVWSIRTCMFLILPLHSKPTGRVLWPYNCFNSGNIFTMLAGWQRWMFSNEGNIFPKISSLLATFPMYDYLEWEIYGVGSPRYKIVWIMRHFKLLFWRIFTECIMEDKVLWKEERWEGNSENDCNTEFKM